MKAFTPLWPARAAIAILLAFSGVTIAAAPVDTSWSPDDAAHLLRRAGFGGTPTQIDRLQAIGRAAAVEYLITGKLPTGAQAPFTAVDLKPFDMSDPSLDKRQGPERVLDMQQLRAWWFDRMVRTDRPLDEKMSLFWHGLFTSGVRECKVALWMAEQNALFHKEAIGNYQRLTREVIHDPAMLKYLNNDENVRGKPNENLARELMELFTMGEGNGYAEQDIPEVARALTGLAARPPRLGGGGAVMRPLFHDNGRKTIFGKTGNFGPDDVVALIFDRPEPADYLARRLWTFFASPTPTDADVRLVAQSLRQSHWELAPALRVMFNSPAFYSDKSKLTIIKSPIELEVGTLRLLEEPAEPRIVLAAVGGARQLGEDLFQPPNVKGWPGGEHWITSSAVYARYNIAAAMANGMYGGGNLNIGALRGKENAGNGKKPAAEVGAANVGAVPDSAELKKLASDEVTAAPPEKAKAAKNADAKQAAAQAARVKAREMMAAMPRLPAPSQLVAVKKLFPQIGQTATADQIVDAAAARFLQQPLTADKHAVLVEAIGTGPFTLGQEQSDRKVRQMIGLLLSTPEYQVQ